MKHANNDINALKFDIDRNNCNAQILVGNQNRIQNNVDKQQNQLVSLSITNSNTTTSINKQQNNEA